MNCRRECGNSASRWLVVSVDGKPGKHAVSYRCRTCGRSRLQLANIEDVEASVAYVARRHLHAVRVAAGGYVSDADADDFTAFLAAEAWSLWLRWQPDRGVPFGAYLFRFLPLRATDFYRSQLGRHGHKLPAADPVGIGLGRADTEEQGDPQVDSAPDVPRLVCH